MNALLALSDDEVQALMDFHADRIGHGDEAAAERSIKRIEQLRRLTAPERRYDVEGAA